jgi:hypothetical protein
VGLNKIFFFTKVPSIPLYLSLSTFNPKNHPLDCFLARVKWTFFSRVWRKKKERKKERKRKKRSYLAIVGGPRSANNHLYTSIMSIGA